MPVSETNLILVAATAAASPLLASTLKRWIAIPLVVFEIVLGILIGPDVLGWIGTDPYLGLFANFGLAMLFFLAGYEIDFARIRGRPLRRSAAGWMISLVVGVVLGVLVAPNAVSGVLVGICLTSTALGTLMPMLRDAGELQRPFGASILAVGAAGEFGPLIAVALFLSGRSPARSAIILAVFALILIAALLFTVRIEHTRIHQLIEATLHTSGQFAVRLVMLILAVLVALATAFGLDMLLGAFSAGVLVNLLLASADPQATKVVEAKLDAVGFGFLVPIFFINTGVSFDLDAILHDARTMILVPLCMLFFLLVRGVPSMLSLPENSGWRDRLAIGFLGATGLPIIVAVTAIGVDHGELHESTAAALVGAGMLSVLCFPLVGLRLRRGAP